MNTHIGMGVRSARGGKGSISSMACYGQLSVCGELLMFSVDGLVLANAGAVLPGELAPGGCGDGEDGAVGVRAVADEYLVLGRSDFDAVAFGS